MRNMPIRRRAAFAGALIAASLLAGCAPMTGGTDMGHGGESSSSAVEANAADTMFVMMMIPHHEQAIEMADLLLAKDGVEPRARELAEQIKAAQAPEIELMEGWLEDWGVPGHDSDMGDMDHGGGMMSEDDMNALQSANGLVATRLFLEGMIEHHDGAIEMAESVIESGQNPDVRDLAERIIVDQTAEIGNMWEILAVL